MNIDGELQKRIGTAVIGLALLYFLIVPGGVFGTAVLALVLSLAMWVEYTGLTLELLDRSEKRLFLILLSFVSFIFLQWTQVYSLLIITLTFGAMGVYFLLTAWRHEEVDLQIHTQEMAFSMLGIIYLTVCPSFLPWLRSEENGLHFVLLFLFMNWAGDIAAYFVGKRFGSRPLYKRISPKKTWEGAIGGLIATVGVAVLYGSVQNFGVPLFVLILISLIVGTVAQLGDLLESLFKRAFRKKDSGSILPGHGGILDRFDGIILSLPVMYGCVILFS